MELGIKEKLKVASLIGEIQGLGYMVNAFTNYCVFVRYAGHVDRIEVHISASKEKYNDYVVEGDVSANPDFYYKNFERGNAEAVMIELTKLKYQLRKILREKKIDYSKLDYEIEEVRHYKLV